MHGGVEMSPVSSVLEWPASDVAFSGFLVQSMAFLLCYCYYVGTFFVIIWQSLPLPLQATKRRFGKVEPTFQSAFSKQRYAPQTKILEVRTNLSECVSRLYGNARWKDYG
jgi:hypothetical protein